ncbi:hypothetical protein MASR1M68_03050 [Elusimicrobiota bacterium]
MYNKKNHIIFYLFLFVITVYVALMSFFKPLTMDDFFYSNATSGKFIDILKFYFESYLSWGPRIGTLFTLFFLSFFKEIFPFINSAIQISIVFCMHYIVTGKRINPGNSRDLFLFMILSVMFLFNVTGGQTLFWISGVANYSFTILIFFIFLIFFRPLIDGRTVVNDNLMSQISIFILGFVVGMSNENIAPVSVLVILAVFIFCKLNKIQIPKWMFFALAGNFIGLLVLLGAPGSYKRMASVTDFSMTNIFIKLHLQETAQEFLETSFLFKLKFVPLRIGKFIVLSFGLPIFIIIISIFAMVKNNLNIEHRKNIYLSLFFILTSFLLVSILCFAPKPSIRAYFSPLLITFISFSFLLLYITDNFTKKIQTYLILGIILITALLMSVKIIPSFYQLYQINNKNLALIAEALQTPEKNARIYDYDISMKQYHAILNANEDENFHINKEMAKYYGLNSIKLKEDI